VKGRYKKRNLKRIKLKEGKKLREKNIKIEKS
jgi:hypothetical protein